MRKSKPKSSTKTPKSAATTNGLIARGKSVRTAKGKSTETPPAAAGQRSKSSPRVLPRPDELRSLYQRYTAGSSFDDHDKAFYFALDVGGVSRAKQLLAHVEEVLAELEEFRG